MIEEKERVYVCGSNSHGQLATGSEEDTHVFVPSLPLLNTFTSIHCGGCHCLGVDVNQNVYGWGSNEHGQTTGLPPATPTTALTIAALDNTSAENPTSPNVLHYTSPQLLFRAPIPVLSVACGWTHSALLTGFYVTLLRLLCYVDH